MVNVKIKLKVLDCKQEDSWTQLANNGTES